MDSTIRIGSSILLPTSSSSTPKLSNLQRNDKIGYGFLFSGNGCITKISAITPKGSVFPSASSHGDSSSLRDVHGRRSSLESLFYYDKPIPEERIDEPVGVFLAAKVIEDNPRCTDCQVKGAVLCTTCSGSGLYVDSILESQGIIVKRGQCRRCDQAESCFPKSSSASWSQKTEREHQFMADQSREPASQSHHLLHGQKRKESITGFCLQ